MYAYSHEKDGGWLGEFERPSDCLISARAMYGDDTPIYIAELRGGNYSDLFIGADTLLSYMREDAAAKPGDIDTDCFDYLLPEDVARLNGYMIDLIGEFEADLPDAAQFKGSWVKQIRVYRQGMEVRPGHWT